MGEDAGGWSVLAISALMMLVGVLATALPARRGLRIQPTEALRAD
jgi:ABC-type lipoprotein release transport system permease subunit